MIKKLLPALIAVLLMSAGCREKSVRIRYTDGSERRYQTIWSDRKIQNRMWLTPDVLEVEVIDHNGKTVYEYRKPYKSTK